jgi:hypothetical protein
LTQTLQDRGGNKKRRIHDGLMNQNTI